MKKLDRFLKITAAICAVVFIMGLVGTGIGIHKIINGDLGAVGLDKETIDRLNEKNPITNTYKSSDVKNIYVEGSMSNVIIKENSESDSIVVDSTHSDDTKFNLENGVLSIKMNKSYLFSNSFKRNFNDIINVFNLVDSNRTITIEVPKDITFENVNVDVDYGDIKILSGNYKSLYINSDFGKTDVFVKEYTLIEEVKAESSFGDIELNNIDAVNFTAHNSKGRIKINMENEINKSLNKMDIENDLGNINLTMKNIDRNIDITNNMGNIDFISKNTLSKNVKVNMHGSLGSFNNDFKYDEKALDKNVDVNIDFDMGNINLYH